MKQINKPAGVFRGQNFMTPDVVAYYKLGKGYAELSKGEFLGNDIYGVTVGPDMPDGSKDPRSKCCHSLAEAKAYIKELS